MRIAFIYNSYAKKTQVEDTLVSIPGTVVRSFYLSAQKLYDENNQHITAHAIALSSDMYVLDPEISFDVRENLHHYFEIYTVRHLYGKVGEIKIPSHYFLSTNTVYLEANHGDIEKNIAQIWTTVSHPIVVKTKEKTMHYVSSVHELRRVALPHLVTGNSLECVHRPKGRNLHCTLIREARGKKIYSSPLFESVVYESKSSHFLSSIPVKEKDVIIKNLESLFEEYVDVPILRVELVHTAKGVYFLHALPLHQIDSFFVPETLREVGMHHREVLQACLASMSTK